MKRIFGDRKVPLSARRRIPVIRDNLGRVLWVCGVVRSDLAPVNDRTGALVSISAVRLDAGEAAVGGQH